MPCLRLTVLALATCAPLTGQETAAAAPSMTFGWPTSGSVTVVESSLKKGVESKMRYRLELSAEQDGGLRVTYHDFEFLEHDGKDATTPRMKKALAQVVSMAETIPDLVISPDGRFVRADGLEEMLERLIADTTERKGEAAGERMRRALARPEARAMMAESTGIYWQTWVGAWRDWSLSSAGEQTADVMMPLFGNDVPAQQTASHLGAVEQPAGNVRLRLRTTVSGPDASKALGASLRLVLASVGAATLPADAVQELSLTDEKSVVTDPETMRPSSARSERLIRVVGVDPDTGERETHEQLERHEYEFDWGAK
ncbi:MAG: hypothetical protein R3F29_09930 [Planctomycetota bacterium]